MDDLISRQAAIDALKQQAEIMSEWSNRYAEQRKGVLTAVNIVRDVPSAQPEHGQWIFSQNHAEGICTRCNFKIYGRPYHNTYMIVPYNYCPNCGAYMMNEVEE